MVLGCSEWCEYEVAGGRRRLEIKKMSWCRDVQDPSGHLGKYFGGYVSLAGLTDQNKYNSKLISADARPLRVGRGEMQWRAGRFDGEGDWGVWAGGQVDSLEEGAGGSLGVMDWSVGAVNWRGNARLEMQEVAYRDAIRLAIMKGEDEV